jgi:hypothetical protein
VAHAAWQTPPQQNGAFGSLQLADVVQAVGHGV